MKGLQGYSIARKAIRTTTRHEHARHAATSDDFTNHVQFANVTSSRGHTGNPLIEEQNLGITQRKNPGTPHSQKESRNPSGMEGSLT